jgi:alpha/beta superfamily hydrolase
VRAEKLEFAGVLGDTLAARLERPDDDTRAFVLFAHCFTCSKDLKSVRRISRSLVEAGMGVLAMDFTGLGESGGDFAETNFSSNLGDLVAAADFLRREHRAPEILVGHSLGGSAALAAAGLVPEARAVATIAAPFDTSHLVSALGPAADEAETRGAAEAVIGGRTFLIRIVPIDHARKIFETARHPKSFVSIDGADHLLLRDRRDARFVGEVLAAWAGRYIGGGAEDVPADANPRER